MAKAYCTYDDFSDMDCCFNEAVVQLRDCFRLLWEQHVALASAVDSLLCPYHSI